MRTKIIATVGPSSRDREILAKLVEAGVRVLRLNFSHGNAESFKDVVDVVRRLEIETHIPITLMMDLSGPKIRIGSVNGDVPLAVRVGMAFLIGPAFVVGTAPAGVTSVPFEHDAVLGTVDVGDVLIIGDGGTRLKVTEKRPDGCCLAEALADGVIASRKGLTLPGKALPVPALTDKDRKDLVEGLALGLDAVAVSFVQTPEDIVETKRIIRENGYDVPVVAKLERRNAVDRLDDIIREADVVMVARGDLGIECPLAEVPALQKRIVRACNKAGKPVIVATQMLVSMVDAPMPTRAEATDVANAVWDGTDCVMMSEETAMGHHPVEAALAMHEIAMYAEDEMREHIMKAPPEDASASEFLAYSACVLAEKLRAKGIVVYGTRGRMARLVSRFRPSMKIYVVSMDDGLVRRLNFSWGIHPRRIELRPGERHLAAVERYVDGSHHFLRGDVVVIASIGVVGSKAALTTNTIRVYCK